MKNYPNIRRRLKAIPCRGDQGRDKDFSDQEMKSVLVIALARMGENALLFTGPVERLEKEGDKLIVQSQSRLDDHVADVFRHSWAQMYGQKGTVVFRRAPEVAHRFVDEDIEISEERSRKWVEDWAAEHNEAAEDIFRKIDPDALISKVRLGRIMPIFVVAAPSGRDAVAAFTGDQLELFLGCILDIPKFKRLDQTALRNRLAEEGY